MAKIISYNVNGIRAAISKGLLEWLDKAQPDILCLQETKAQDDQVSKLLFEEKGYRSYWHFADKKGYSGVGLLTKIQPDKVKTGIGLPKYDSEGRLLRADYGDTTLICTYFPSGTMGDVRQDFKMEWLADFQVYVNTLKKERPHIIVAGDYNICHKPIDINHPEKHNKSSGFLPEERAWMDQFVNSGFIDAFREYNHEPEHYSWWSYRAGARVKNLGWRIDYHMITPGLRPRLKNAGIMKETNHSDHCPVWIEIDI